VKRLTCLTCMPALALPANHTTGLDAPVTTLLAALSCLSSTRTQHASSKPPFTPFDGAGNR
jgi:hypothetical protein